MSNKNFINYLNQKRDFETQYSQAVSRLAVSTPDKRASIRQKLSEIDKAYTEFKKRPIPPHDFY